MFYHTFCYLCFITSRYIFVVCLYLFVLQKNAVVSVVLLLWGAVRTCGPRFILVYTRKPSLKIFIHLSGPCNAIEAILPSIHDPSSHPRAPASHVSLAVSLTLHKHIIFSTLKSSLSSLINSLSSMLPLPFHVPLTSARNISAPKKSKTVVSHPIMRDSDAAAASASAASASAAAAAAAAEQFTKGGPCGSARRTRCRASWGPQAPCATAGSSASRS